MQKDMTMQLWSSPVAVVVAAVVVAAVVVAAVVVAAAAATAVPADDDYLWLSLLVFFFYLDFPIDVGDPVSVAINLQSEQRIDTER